MSGWVVSDARTVWDSGLRWVPAVYAGASLVLAVLALSQAVSVLPTGVGLTSGIAACCLATGLGLAGGRGASQAPLVWLATGVLAAIAVYDSQSAWSVVGARALALALVVQAPLGFLLALDS